MSIVAIHRQDQIESKNQVTGTAETLILAAVKASRKLCQASACGHKPGPYWSLHSQGQLCQGSCEVA